jgi:hypothetical protein
MRNSNATGPFSRCFEANVVAQDRPRDLRCDDCEFSGKWLEVTL